MEVPAGTELAGDPSGSILRAAPDFKGRALLVVRGDGVRLRNFEIDGNRSHVGKNDSGLPPSDVSFAAFTAANGLLAGGVRDLRIDHLRLRNIAGFAILVSRSRGVTIDRVTIEDSGSHNSAGRNNATGGILLEEGTQDFSVTNSELRRIRGNGVWTHSLYASPRNARGRIALNQFAELGRDAIQVGHATEIEVDHNWGRDIGYPPEEVDVEGRAIPVAIDTAGNVDRSRYSANRFENINGKCIDLDGFHDGEIINNICRNSANYAIVMNNTNPDMQSQNIRVVENRVEGALFGGVFVIGTGNTVSGNQFLDLNRAHCNEEAARSGCYYSPGQPEMLEAGIYLGQGAERPAPAHGNTIRDNLITGYKMRERCIARSPDIAPQSNLVTGNRCR
jgi:hypothetical protein